MSNLDDIMKKASRTGEWQDPPEQLVEKLLSKEPTTVPGPEASGTRHPVRELKFTDSAADVRSAPTVDLGAAPVTLAEAFDEGELGLVVADTGRGGRWSLRGMLWLHDTDRERAANLVWVHGEHVVASCRVESGVPFELEETVARGWTLEVHLPSGAVLKLKNPI